MFSFRQKYLHACITLHYAIEWKQKEIKWDEQSYLFKSSVSLNNLQHTHIQMYLRTNRERISLDKHSFIVYLFQCITRRSLGDFVFYHRRLDGVDRSKNYLIISENFDHSWCRGGIFIIKFPFIRCTPTFHIVDFLYV